MRTIQVLLGHGDLETTAKYLHLVAAALTNSIQPAGELYNSPALARQAAAIIGKKVTVVRPAVEVADILRASGDCFREQNRSWLSYQQLKVLRAITACRTAALGGHLDACSGCDHQAISYNSCLMGSVLLWGVRRASG